MSIPIAAVLFIAAIAHTSAQSNYRTFSCYTISTFNSFAKTLAEQPCMTDAEQPTKKCVANDTIDQYGCREISTWERFWGTTCNENSTSCCTEDRCNTDAALIQDYVNNENKDALSRCYESNLQKPQDFELTERVYMQEQTEQLCLWFKAKCAYAMAIVDRKFGGKTLDCNDDDDSDVVIGMGYWSAVQCSDAMLYLNSTSSPWPPDFAIQNAECCTTQNCLPSFAPATTTTTTTATFSTNTATSNATAMYARRKGWAVWLGFMLGLGTYALLIINVF